MDYKNLLETEIKYLRAIPMEGVDALAETIAQRPNPQHTKIITSGMGKAGQIAHTLATTFSSTGTPACFLHPAEAQHGDLGIMAEGDILIIFSNSGKTREVVELLDLVQRLQITEWHSINTKEKGVRCARNAFTLFLLCLRQKLIS